MAAQATTATTLADDMKSVQGNSFVYVVDMGIYPCLFVMHTQKSEEYLAATITSALKVKSRFS